MTSYRISHRGLAFAAILVAALALSPAAAVGHDEREASDGQVDEVLQEGLVAPRQEGRSRNRDGKGADQQAPFALSALGATPCAGGFAGSFPCQGIALLAFLPLAQIGGGNGNDVWGWTDSLTGREYALMGRTTGTSFVDITDPANPVYLGDLPTHSVSSIWRGIKVYADHAFIISEASGHGMQVFDLTQLRTVAAPPVTFAESAHYGGFSTVHTLAVNEESGFLYAAGSNTCNGGLHIIDVRMPARPVFAGCVSDDGYTHETQCVVYRGPDSTYHDRELCFSSNADTLTIVDVTDKAAPVQVSRTDYAGRGYTHQGWLTEDQAWFLLDDETDETRYGHHTRTYVWDVSRLEAPSVSAVHEGPTRAIDHNQYIRSGYAFQANYRSGLRVLDLADIASGSLREVGFFDVYPADDEPKFNGAWSTYPFFASGTVIVSGIEQGLFVLRPALAPGADLTMAALSAPPAAAAGAVISVTDRTANLAVGAAAPSTTRFFLAADATAGPGAVVIGAREVPALAPSATSAGVTSATIPPGTPAGTYYLVARADADGTIDERSEINNTRGTPIAVGPDLVVSAFSAPAEGAPGLVITVNVTALNRGGAAAGGSTTRFFLAATPTSSSGGVPLGALGVGPLGPGESSGTAATLTIPAATAAGSYYVVARADADGVVGEFDETNNARSVAIRIALADLTVSALTVPAAAGAGGSISVSDTTRNAAGAGPAGPSTTRFYLSQNTALDASDVLLGSRDVPALAAGASSTATTALGIPAGTATGRYYVLVQADSVAEVAETSETNNTRGDPIVVSPPDLSVVELSAPARGGAGLPVAVMDTTRNMTGVGPAAASVTRFFLSKAAGGGPGDTSLGERAVPTLPPGSKSVGTTTVTIPSGTAPGAYYIVAKADGPATLAETNEANNVRSVQISVGPDLVVTALSAPATGGAGLPLAVMGTVTNQGGGMAAVSTLRFYLSTNGSYGAGDVLLGSRGVPSLAPAVADSGSTTLTIPSGTPAGTFYIVALVGGAAETDDTNNARSVVVKMSPDLVVSVLSAPLTARAGATISVTDTTKNGGQGVAASTTTRVYLSANARVDPSDADLGSRAVPVLAAAQASTGTISITIPAGTPPGSYYLVAKADADGVVAEASEGNNTWSRAITIAP